MLGSRQSRGLGWCKSQECSELWVQDADWSPAKRVCSNLGLTALKKQSYFCKSMNLWNELQIVIIRMMETRPRYTVNI
jgi:hypothetical protein